jgi:hypothetical protein
MRPGLIFDPGMKNRTPRSSHDDIVATCAICGCVAARSNKTGAHHNRHEERAELPGSSHHDDIAATVRPARRVLPALSD